MMLGSSRAFAAAVAAVSVGLSAQSQQPVFRAGTDLVQLDVVVRDKDGRPVHGLAKDDFEVFASGKPRPVVVVNEYRRDATPSGPVHLDVATNAGDQLVLFVLNDHATARMTVRTATAGGTPITGTPLVEMKDAARRLIRGLAGRAQMALLRMSAEPGVEFTNDAQALLDALDVQETWKPPVIGVEAKWILSGATGLIPPSQSPSGNGPARPINPIPNTIVGALRDESLLASDGRRKVVVLISSGEIQLWPQFTQGLASDGERGRLDDERKLALLPDKLRDVVKSARKSNSTIYVVDPRQSNRTAATNTAKLIEATQQSIASVTGGYAALGDDSLESGLARIREDLDNYYVLGFSPIDPRSSTPQSLEVRVKGEGLDVRHRTRYVSDAATRDAARRASATDPLLGLAYSPLPVPDLPLRLWTTVIPSEKSAARVVLWLDSGDEAVSEYAVWTIDERTKKEATKPVGRTLSGAVPTLLPLEGPALKPGRYQVRVAARTSGDRGGSVFASVAVPDYSKMPLAIAAVAIGEFSDPRNDAEPLPFAPLLDRTFDSDFSGRVSAEIWQQGTSEPAYVTMTIVNSSDVIVRRAEREVAAHNGSQRIDFPIYLRELPSGQFTLRLTVTNGSITRAHEIGFAVR